MATRNAVVIFTTLIYITSLEGAFQMTLNALAPLGDGGAGNALVTR